MSGSTSKVPSGGAQGQKTPRKRRTSAASAGGAAGASGVGLQNRVFGWAAAAMAAEKPLLNPNLVAGTVARVGAQTGYDLDDVAVQTDADNYALFQVKAGLGLGKAESSPLAEALEQAVKQYLDGLLRAPDGTERQVDPVRDALVLCTDSSAPATVRLHLAQAITRTASQPPGTPLGYQLTEPQVKALNVVLVHVRRLWEATKRPTPDDESLRMFLRVLRVVTIDVNDGEPDHVAAVALLSSALPVPGDADAVWPVLVAVGAGRVRGAELARLSRDR